MIASSKRQRKIRGDSGPDGRTFCRIVGEEVGPDGKTDLLIEPITDPQEQEAARKRYAVAMMRWFAEAKKKHSLRSPAIFGDGDGI
jgi:hypothetical protein